MTNNRKLENIVNVQMSSADFKKLSVFITDEFGIKMPEVKKTMLQSRLHKRLKALDMTSFKDYCELVFDKEKGFEEIIHLIDVVSTNKTDFFREAVHFDYLSKTALPEFTANPLNRNKTFKIWSAGCSSGEEPYTIAITMNEFIEKYGRLDYSILGTDISTDILKKAASGVYKEMRIATIPMTIKKKYFLRSRDSEKKLVRVVEELRKKVFYQRLNFMDHNYEVRDDNDVVFCRNVLIYFDRDIQEKVINRLCRKLNKGGIFFLGHSESILKMDVPLEQIKPTIFRKI